MSKDYPVSAYVKVNTLPCGPFSYQKLWKDRNILLTWERKCFKGLVVQHSWPARENCFTGLVVQNAWPENVRNLLLVPEVGGEQGPRIEESQGEHDIL